MKALDRAFSSRFYRGLELRALIIWLIQDIEYCREARRFDLVQRRERQLGRLTRLHDH
jgi:hypothetical protein